MIRTFFMAVLVAGLILGMRPNIARAFRPPSGGVTKPSPRDASSAQTESSPHPRSDRSVDQRPGSEPTTAAHRLQAVAPVAPLQLVEQRGHEPRPAGAERVTECDRSAVDVHAIHVGMVLLLPRQHH